MVQEKDFHLNRQVNLSFIVELILLASLIVGSWVNLQRQLDGLQRDVELLLKNQQRFVGKVELVQENSIAMEYRLRALESE